MTKRVLDTDFWTDMDVIDNYSPEDKYFYLYLLSNGKSTQVGIYQLPVKVIGFETGYSADAVQVLLDRFSYKYGQIIYSKETQEVSITKSLQFSILKGGKPVTDLLEKELAAVKDTSLIQSTYDEMLPFWNLSKRVYDKTIKKLFEDELSNRKELSNQNEHQNQNENESKNVNDNDSNNDNDNEESWATNRSTNRHENRSDADAQNVLERFANIIKKYNPTLEEAITDNNIVMLYYQEVIGDVPKYVENQIKNWEKEIPKPIILEAISRSLKASHPLPYAGSILNNWLNAGVKTYEDILELDRNFNK